MGGRRNNSLVGLQSKIIRLAPPILHTKIFPTVPLRVPVTLQKPNAQELIDKIIPYQGWIGVALTFFGIWGAFNLLINIGSMGIGWMVGLAIAIVEFGVGFLLAYGLISKHLLEKNEEAKIKGQELRNKLIQYQVPGGLALIVLGILSIIF